MGTAEGQDVAMLRAMAKQMGFSLAAITETEQPPKPSTASKHRTELPDGAGTKTAAAPATPPAQTGGNGKARKPSKYGRSPVVPQPGHGKTQAQLTHEARVVALENALPGLCKVAYVFSVGKNAQNKFEKNMALCQNVPYTWIELPGGKAFRLPGLTAQQVRDKIKSCGYGYSPKNQLWVTRSDGTPANARWAGCREIGKAMLSVDET